MKSISFHYKKVIDSDTDSNWEKLIWEDSFEEFKQQFKNYNNDGNIFTLKSLINQGINIPSLEYQINGTIISYIQQLNGIYPGLIDNIGEKYFYFEKFQFQLIDSDIRNKYQHKIALNFFSIQYQFLESIGEYLIIEKKDEPNSKLHTIRLVPYLSVNRLGYE